MEAVAAVTEMGAEVAAAVEALAVVVVEEEAAVVVVEPLSPTQAISRFLH